MSGFAQMVRVLGALCVFIGFSSCGFLAAASLRAQDDTIRAFSESILLLHAEIAYGAESLPEIFAKASESSPEPLCGLFRWISESICDKPGKGLTEHIKAALAACSAPIPSAVRKSLLYLGASLGGTDREGQLQALELCTERVREEEERMGERLAERCRTCGIAGVCLGAAASILLW